MADPFDADDFLDVLACLRQIEQVCPSSKAQGTAKGLVQACQYEMAGERAPEWQGTVLLRNYNKLVGRIAGWTGPLAERVKARLQEHHARLSGR